MGEQDEVLTIQEALEKREEEPTEDNLSDGSSLTCPICKHPAKQQATEIYLQNNKNIDAVSQWFSNKFKKSYAPGTMEKHFKEHVDPFIGTLMIVKEKNIKDLEAKIARTDNNTNRVALIKEMLFDMITDVYSFKTKPKRPELMSKEDRVNYQKDAKTMVELSKSFREYYQMEFELLGIGKSEDEQKEMMKNYVTVMLKKVMDSFDDMPDAQERLSDLLNVTPGEVSSES